jgi:hypothetical protein
MICCIHILFGYTSVEVTNEKKNYVKIHQFILGTTSFDAAASQLKCSCGDFLETEIGSKNKWRLHKYSALLTEEGTTVGTDMIGTDIHIFDALFNFLWR